MKAVVVETFGPIKHANYVHVPDPIPKLGEAVIDVMAVEVNFPDILVIEGNYQVKPPLPFSPGKTAAGVVTSIGEEVKSLKLGDRVVAHVEFGAYAEKVLAPAANCHKIPDTLPFESAAALGLVYQTSYFALVERARIQKGERILVLGASGGIGIAACQLARALGASQVIGGVVSINGTKSTKHLSCDHIIELSSEDLLHRLRDEVYSVTESNGVDIIIDPVGGHVFAAALRALAWRGRHVVIGFASGCIPKVKTNYLLVKNIEVSGLQWSDYRDHEPAWVQSVQTEIFLLWKNGKIVPKISKTMPLAKFKEALEFLKAGNVQGKIILTPSLA